MKNWMLAVAVVGATLGASAGDCDVRAEGLAASFAKVVQAFRDNDVRFFPWPSGYNWTLSKGKRDDGSYAYESREAFAKMAHFAIRERKGDVFVKHPSWYQGGEMPVLCRGDRRTRAWWTPVGHHAATSL